ncbi:unnamed protein product [Diatraea saccharalis]|uniref:Regulatory protein zeste n=1 Tax=Diatraea saccharalis TaxID=40085 RepID=A0A9N9WKG4_9NEOP|nr:unnamed protein product [Diatraea saccharalis]
MTTMKTKKTMTQDEVIYLVELIQDKPALMTKATNATTNKLKDEAWLSVTTSFNAKCLSIPRNKEQLKLKWDNLKKAARKRSQLLRMNNLKTGGGKPEGIPPDDILDKVAGLLGSTCSGFEVSFGGDRSDNNVVLVEDSDVEIQDSADRNDASQNISEEEYNPSEGKFRNRHQDTGVLQRNLAIAKYYEKKTEKLELEIQLLKESINNNN